MGTLILRSVLVGLDGYYLLNYSDTFSSYFGLHYCEYIILRNVKTSLKILYSFLQGFGEG